MRRIALVPCLGLVVFAAILQAEEPKKPSDELALAKTAKADEFNDAAAPGAKPVRGGVLRIGYPSDPKALQYARENDQPTRDIHEYIAEGLINRDRENFEYIPELARYWKVRDVVYTKDGKRLEGRVVSESDEKIVFAEGVSKWTIAQHELEPIKEGATKVTWKAAFGGGDIPARAISYWPGARWTVYVEEAGEKTTEIKVSDVKMIEEETDGRKTQILGVLREIVIEYKLRSGVEWTDGKPFGADDVLFTYRTIMNGDALAAAPRSYLADVVHPDPATACVKLSDDSVRFELKKQYYLGVGATGSTLGSLMMPAHRYDEEKFKGDRKGFAEHWNNHPEHQATVGTGPYKLLKWEKGKYLDLVRNDNWWASQPGKGVPWYDPQMPYLDKIRWVIIENKNARLKELMSGRLDADYDVEQLTWVNGETNSDEFKKKFVRANVDSTSYTYIGWNLKRPDVPANKNFFTDKKVRLAMTMLIDRNKILKEIHFGLGEMVTGPFFGKGPYNDKSIEPPAYNPKKAEALLEQAGWVDHDGDGIRDKDGVKLEFTYSVHTARDYHLKIAEIVKQDLEKAGMKVSIKATDFNSFLETVKSRKFDVIRFAWGDPDCVDHDPYQMWHSSQWENEGSNHTAYANAEVDDLILKCRRELDFRKRQRMMKKIHRLIHEDQPYTFLFNLYELYFYDKKFRNVKFTIIGDRPFRLTNWFIPKELQGDTK